MILKKMQRENYDFSGGPTALDKGKNIFYIRNLMIQGKLTDQHGRINKYHRISTVTRVASSPHISFNEGDKTDIEDHESGSTNNQRDKISST